MFTRDIHEERRLAESERRGWTVPMIAIVFALFIASIIFGHAGWFVIGMFGVIAGWIAACQWAVNKRRDET